MGLLTPHDCPMCEGFLGVRSAPTAQLLRGQEDAITVLLPTHTAIIAVRSLQLIAGLWLPIMTRNAYYGASCRGLSRRNSNGWLIMT